ncbi:MAG: hypothetical protein JG769_1716 [Oscillospiraceae bacterium]|nr:hypothetical protein [Oscillospiraceae bacterium]
MKKIIAAFISVMLMVSCWSLTAFADEDAKMVPVVVKVPESWGTPNLWAWADNGTNAFEAWPGEEMEALAEGWYYIYVPSFVQKVIVNAKQGTEAAIQTDNIAVEAGKEVWITVAEDKTAAVSYEAQIRGEIPKYVKKFVVHAYVPLSWKTVNIWAWSAPDGKNAFEKWPGDPMKEGEDGWFTGKVPTWINSLIINGNEGSVQTKDIAVESKELWITVYDDLTYNLSYENPNKAVKNITVHAQVPADWSGPCCWAWSAPDGTNAFDKWPGKAMTKDGDWYTIEVPGWINSVIINAKDGSIQTSDLSVEAGKDIWVVVNNDKNATVTYEEPAGGATSAGTETSATEVTSATEAASATEASAKNGGNTMVIIIVAAAIVIIGCGVAVVIKKKKE